jgi:hypothetical protein
VRRSSFECRRADLTKGRMPTPPSGPVIHHELSPEKEAGTAASGNS